MERCSDADVRLIFAAIAQNELFRPTGIAEYALAAPVNARTGAEAGSPLPAHLLTASRERFSVRETPDGRDPAANRTDEPRRAAVTLCAAAASRIARTGAEAGSPLPAHLLTASRERFSVRETPDGRDPAANRTDEPRRAAVTLCAAAASRIARTGAEAGSTILLRLFAGARRDDLSERSGNRDSSDDKGASERQLLQRTGTFASAVFFQAGNAIRGSTAGFALR